MAHPTLTPTEITNTIVQDNIRLAEHATDLEKIMSILKDENLMLKEEIVKFREQRNELVKQTDTIEVVYDADLPLDVKKIVKKRVPKKKVVKPDPVVQEETTTTVEKKKGTNRGPVSFGQAFKENKAKGKKEFSWKGKKYHTRTKDEEAKSNKKTTPKKTKTKTYTPPKKTIDDISGVNVLGMQHGPKYKKGGYMRRGGKK